MLGLGAYSPPTPKQTKHPPTRATHTLHIHTPPHAHLHAPTRTPTRPHTHTYTHTHTRTRPQVPLPEGHRFPMLKYAATRAALQQDGSLEGRLALRPAAPAALEDLALVHCRQYVERFRWGQAGRWGGVGRGGGVGVDVRGPPVAVW